MTPSIYLYRARWFSTSDWQSYNREILAESEAQVRAYVERETPTQFRMRWPNGLPRGSAQVDSLDIQLVRQVELPFAIDYSDCP